MSTRLLEKEEEKRLIKEIEQGDEQAFLRLYDFYWNRLFLYISGILRDGAEAEDLVQEVFITLWQMREKLLQINDLKSYMFVIARNMALKKIMTNKKNIEYFDSFIDFFTERKEESFLEHYEAKELACHIDREIGTLPPKMKEVFLLSREAGLSNREISEQLEISEHTVKKQINNSIRRIKVSINHLHSFL